MDLFDICRSYQVLMIVDQRLTRKKAGGMRVRPHALVDYVERRKLPRPEREEAANLVGIQPHGTLRLQLSLNTMNIRGWESCRVDEVLFGQFVVALWIGGRHAALIHKKEMHPAPAESRLSHFGEQQLGRRAARYSQRGPVAGRQRFFQQIENLVRARCGGLLRI